MKRKRPLKTRGFTFKKRVGCGTVYTIINHDDNGPIEIFITLGKAGGCIGTLLSIISRMMTLALRYDADIKQLLRYIKDIPCPMSTPGTMGCPEAIAESVKEYLKLYRREQREQDLRRRREGQWVDVADILMEEKDD